MPIEKEIRIVGETKQADSVLSKLTDVIKELIKAYKDADEEISKTSENVGDLKNETDDLDKSIKKTTKSTNYLSKGFKNVGTAIKGAGIGLVISLIAGLTDAFRSNQKIMDGVNVVLETTRGIFSAVTNVLVSVYESTIKSTENFNGLSKVLKGLLTIYITPLKLGFDALKLGVLEAQLVWEKSYFGDKEPKKIKELIEDIKETKESLKETSTEAIKAGKDVANNFSDAVGEVSTITKKVSKGIEDINVKSISEQSKRLVNQRNNAKLAIAEQGRLVEQYDRQAEKIRQLRDTDQLSVKERYRQNELLIEVFDKQEKAMLSQADSQISLAKTELSRNNNVENRVALTDALANKEGVLAQIEGFRSEQLANRSALTKELDDLEISIFEGKNERRLITKEQETEDEENAILKLEKQKEVLELEYELLNEDYERKKELHKKGTQARTDADNEYLKNKLNIENKILKNEKKTTAEKLRIAKALEDRRAQIRNKAIAVTEKAFGVLAKIDEENKTLQAVSIIGENATGIAKQIINTQAANAAVLTRYGGNAGAAAPETIFNNISMGLGIASSIQATTEALSALGKGGSPSNGSGSENQVAPPSFNIVEGTQQSQLNETVETQNATPVKAYVVSTEITNEQALNQKIKSNASL